MWSHRKSGEPSAKRGFVLIEVLVAASVAAILLAAVMRIFASTWSGISTVREEATAMLVLRNVIDASAPRTNLTAGTQQGVSGRYAWRVIVTNANPQPEAGNAPILASTGPSFSNGTNGSNGNNNTNGANGASDPNNPNGGKPADTGPPWNLFRIDVVVQAPNGRRTLLETYRLSRAAQ